VHSDDGLDEISLGARTQVFDIQIHDIQTYSFEPEDAGLPRIPLAHVKTGTPAENASRIRAVLSGAPGPDRDYIVINAAAAFMVVGRASTLEEGARLAAQTIDSGAAAKTLDAYVAASNGAAS
jgi:anthranilate phosphoribosyltransferase